jgi:hypothetical protein
VKVPRTNRPKARKAPIKHAPPASLRDKLDQLTRELGEASQRETATSEVLKVISSSPGELEPVFDAMLANATRICQAKFGTLLLQETSDLGTIFAAFPACNISATLDAIRCDVAPTRPANSRFCTSQICAVSSIQGVAASSDPFALRGCRRAFELA